MRGDNVDVATRSEMPHLYFKLPAVWDNLKPVKFHPYTSRVLHRLISIECISKDSEAAYLLLQKHLLTIFQGANINCWPDNKIVFEVEVHGVKVFYGFYDWRFSIGLSYSDDNE